MPPNLIEGLTYEFKIVINDQYFSDLYGFDILDLESKDITIINGGDVGWNSDSVDMNSMLRNHPADIIIIGGDIAYGNNMNTCYSTWDMVLSSLPYQTVKDN